MPPFIAESLSPLPLFLHALLHFRFQSPLQTNRPAALFPEPKHTVASRMASRRGPTALLLLLILLLSISPLTTSQGTATLSHEDACKGVFLSYRYDEGTRKPIFPKTPVDPNNKPYAFSATATVTNTDSVPLESWSLHVGLRDRTVLVSASNAILTNGSALPYIVNGTAGVFFSGFPNTDLKTAIETAGDETQYGAKIVIIGTDFGEYNNKTSPAPISGLSLDNPAFLCPQPTRNFSFIFTCCTRDPMFRSNSSISEVEHQRQPGDLSITYDVLKSYEGSYIALVTIENDSPFGRLDNWRLNWTWKQQEFIWKMQGAYTTVTDPSDCVLGKQGEFYKGLDLSGAVNCQQTPTIVDLPISMFNNSDFGRIPFCCRNGTILPHIMDPTQSKSAFQLEVRKMPPHMNKTDFAPPQDWKISGSVTALNPSYKCLQPVRISQSRFPDPSGLPTLLTAVASWQVVCNITTEKPVAPRCCVSFSGFYNDSVVPCRTCACGCPANVGKTCSTKSPAMLLPPEALLVPFDNRTVKARAWAEIKHYNQPDPLPCGDYCGVSVNWHVYTDYRDGWSARITLFNWENSVMPDWFAAVVLKKAYDGFEQMYSFNGTAIGNDTIFMKGLPGLNYLVAENDEVDPRDPGKLQTVISFTKKLTPGIDVLGGDGFPTKVIFNGEECSLPDGFPANHGIRGSSVTGGSLGLVLAVLMSLVMLMGL